MIALAIDASSVKRAVTFNNESVIALNICPAPKTSVKKVARVEKAEKAEKAAEPAGDANEPAEATTSAESGESADHLMMISINFIR